MSHANYISLTLAPSLTGQARIEWRKALAFSSRYTTKAAGPDSTRQPRFGCYSS